MARSKKGATVKIRLELLRDDVERLAHAANLCGSSLARFIVDSAEWRARDVLKNKPESR